MKVKKIIAAICAAAISASVLAMTVSAGSDPYIGYSKNPKVELRGNLTVSSSQAVCTASIGDDPSKYNTAQARVDILTANMKHKTSGLEIPRNNNTFWNTGGAGCSVVALDGYSIIDANAYCNYNINGQIYNSRELKANA